MSMFWSPIVQSLAPYVPGEQPGISKLIKLNTNENPYPPSPLVTKALQDVIGRHAEGLRLYPDPSSLLVRQAVADLWGLSKDEIFVGNGSDEVLAFTFQALLNHRDKGPLIFPDITYSFYPSYCKLFDISYVQIPLNEHFECDLSLVPQHAGGLIFPNPNAPTGIAMARATIDQFLAGHPHLMVVIDEAYVDFGAESCVPLIKKYPNLLVTQSLSKSRALAGLRVGLAMGSSKLIEGLTRVKDSFNSYPIDRLAQAAATAALGDTAWLEENRREIISEREKLTGSLKTLGFQVLPSCANFVFARHPKKEGPVLLQALRDRNILVRQFNHPRIKDFLRMTVGTSFQNSILIKTLDEILA